MALIIETEKYRNKYDNRIFTILKPYEDILDAADNKAIIGKYSDKDNYEIIYKCYFDQIFEKYEE